MTTYNYNFETKANTFNSLRHVMTDVEFALQTAVETANNKLGATDEYVIANIGTPITTSFGEIIIKNPESFSSESSIYRQMDLYTLIKYLYYGGNRLESGPKSKRYCNDQTCFFRYFDVPYNYTISGVERKLFAEYLSDAFSVLLEMCSRDSENDDFYTAKNAIKCIEAMMSVVAAIDDKFGEESGYYGFILSELIIARFGAVDADAEEQIRQRIAKDDSSKAEEITTEQIIRFESEEYFNALEHSDEFEADFAKTAQDLYYKGLECLKNLEYEQAVSLFNNAIEMSECAPACYELGKCLQRGQGVRKDTKQAFELFEIAAKDYPPANFALAEAYHYGLGVAQDFTRAEAYYFKSCTNTELGIMTLANSYLYGIGFPKNETKAFEIFEKAVSWCEERIGDQFCYAELNQKLLSDFELRLADCYRYGIGTDKNLESAEFWYRRAVKSGNADAAYVLASLYYDERETEENEQLSNKLLKLAAKLGSKPAKRLCVINDYDGCQDPDDFMSYCRPELEWLRSMEHSADLMILCKLAELYDTYGFHEEAIEIYCRALNNGSARAERILNKA